MWKNYFDLVEHEDEKEAAKEAIWKWGHGPETKKKNSPEFCCKQAMTEKKITLLPLSK